ncbi:DUF4091 domain-containing protein [Sporosarcina sp. Marseille-Q4063]|uniref:DUF4091 domain-containing protein n=1 Tax=Sporosarcina sp. Marseille-Q4063 TaxID=2810514 RepID=UPI001BAFB9F1|nr:DUF4091 domain-containing protein [Sporosarcina sp. Marseille-Q4063]QUW21517.1 DUF4091 domain-containing protein [Sporosarcina sp. Marseille-Q4063]
MSAQEYLLDTRCLSSLVKVFADEELKESAITEGTALLNEVYAFQVAYKRSGSKLEEIAVNVESDIRDLITIRAVGLVPSEFPVYHNHDDNILRMKPGLFPDPLYPLEPAGLSALPYQWRSLWIKVDLTSNTKPGIHKIFIKFETAEAGTIAEETFNLEVIPEVLPEPKLIQTNWLHTDCIATYYKTDVFSEKHWSLISKFIKTAVNHDINMVLTPLFTPPLDTEVGAERPTVQLVDIEIKDEIYHFCFNKLKRWVDMCNQNGVKYFEFAHLYSQWGAEHAPKIMAVEKGEYKQIFGWKTDAHGKIYRDFLSKFLPELVLFIERNGLSHRVYFHISDEPGPNDIKAYKDASDHINTFLSDYPIIDALSDYEYYEKGIVKKPIPGTNYLEPFLEKGVPDLWTYYCCGQYKEVANRFFAFPSARNRIIGMQLYKFNMTGFLHWGFNFWYSQLSKKKINPFQVTDADHGFPSGDAFVVYPGENGPIESLRLEVFYEALQDIRALQLLESYVGKKAVIELLEEGLNEPLTFTKYPQSGDWLLKKREQVNREIKDRI